MACVLSLWAPRVVPHRHSYLPWEGWTAACPRHLALVQLPGDLGYVLARRGGGLDVIHSRHMDHGRARRRRYIYSQKMAGFPESLSKDSAPLSFLLVHCPGVLAGFYSQPPSPPGSVSFWIFLPLSFPAHPQISIKDFIPRRDTSLRIQIRLPATCSLCSG